MNLLAFSTEILIDYDNIDDFSRENIDEFNKKGVWKKYSVLGWRN